MKLIKLSFASNVSLSYNVLIRFPLEADLTVQDPQQPDPNAEFHCVHFFEPSQFPTAPIANFLEQGLSQGEAALLLSSLDHAAQLGAKVEEAGWNVLDLREVGLWDVADVDQMLHVSKPARRSPRLWNSTSMRR